MKNLRKSLGLFAAAFALCMVFALGAKVNAADVEMQIGNADAEKGEVQTMSSLPNFNIAYISSDKTRASVAVDYKDGDDWNRVGLFDENDRLIAVDDTTSYASFSGLSKNKVYYYRVQKVSELNGTAISPWSDAKSFTTLDSKKIKFKGVKNQKACTIKVPKVNGVKNYTLYMSTKYDKGFKKVKNIKPGKKIKLTKFKKKSFKIGKRYYIRLQVNTKKSVTCGNYYEGSVYFYRTIRF